MMTEPQLVELKTQNEYWASRSALHVCAMKEQGDTKREASFYAEYRYFIGKVHVIEEILR
jgi:hypothetical protein